VRYKSSPPLFLTPLSVWPSRQFMPQRALYNPGQVIPKRRNCIGEAQNPRVQIANIGMRRFHAV
jgi:hypothetical protein